MSLRGSGIEPRDVRTERPAERNLRINTISLVLSNLLAGALGLVFWGAAARLFPAQEVGVGAALITSALMLSTLSILSLDTVFERFLPLAGTLTGRLIKHGLLVVAATGALSGAAFVAFGPRHALFESSWAMVCYPVLVMVLAVFTLQDAVTVGLGVARWAAAKNSFLAVARVVALVIFVLAGTHSAMSIVLAWGATASAAVLCLVVAVRRRYRSNPRFLVPPNLPSRRQLWSYFGSSSGMKAVWAIAPFVVPLIVITQVGAEANAHFAIAWQIISGLYLTVHLVVSPYVAEVAANPDQVASLSWRMVRMVTAVVCAGSVGLVVAGPVLLSVVGAEYRAAGQGLLYFAAVFVPLSAVSAVYEAFARVQRKLALVLVVRCASTCLIVLGSLVGTRSLGIAGVGWAYLVAELVSALVLLPPIVVWLRRATHESGCVTT